MKRLIIIRHSKAEDQLPELSDQERSLTTTGKNHSKLVSAVLKTKEKTLGLVFTSPAFRAIETALIFCREFNTGFENIRICPDLYLMSEPDSYLSFINSMNEETDIVTLVGHNPMLSEIARFFSDNKTEDLPKTGVICLNFKTVKWSSIEPRSGTVEYSMSPKTLL